MKLLTATVNYKTPDLTMKAVRTLMPELNGLSSKVIIVDNDSQDGSAEKLREDLVKENWGDQVILLESGRNGGFGYGNNCAIRYVLATDDLPEYVYLLNSDAFPEPKSIQTLVEWMDAHPYVGIAGSAIIDESRQPFVNAFRFHGIVSEFESSVRFGPLSWLLAEHNVVIDPMPTEACEVDWVGGASMIIRRQMLDDVGLFDEAFFLYFEETELCLRAKRKGWPTWYVPEAAVGHIGCASTGAYSPDRRQPNYWFDSRSYYYRKQFGPLYAGVADAAFLAGQSIWKVRQLIERKPRRDPRFYVRDFLSHKLGLPRWPE
ncbi:MAG: glycosyltransferase family 2 protein [Myxococcales bacterium]|nr:glycosyltransferase family 2 protein [Myxococcales bacterium]